MSEIIIREVTTNVWTFSKPFARFGWLPIGGRSTAIKLESGEVWVLVSTPLTAETKTKLGELGDVKYLIAPDAVHSLYIGEFQEAYPEAKCIGVEPLGEKKKTIKWAGLYGRDPPDTKYGFEPEIQACYFPAHPNKDVAFLHAPSKSVLEADLLFNLPATEQYSKVGGGGYLGHFTAFGPNSGLHKWLTNSLASKDPKGMKRDAQTVLGWDFDRIIPCHGDVIETGAKEAWKAAFERVLKD